MRLAAPLESVEVHQDLLALDRSPREDRARIARVVNRPVLAQQRPEKPTDGKSHRSASWITRRRLKSSDPVDKSKALWLILVTVAGCLALAGCTADPGKPAGAAPPRVRLSFIQQRIDEGTSRADLRVVSHEGRSLAVTAIGLDWPGYGGHRVQHYETTVAPRQTLDLRMTLPPPACATAGPPAYGIVVLDGTTVRARIDRTGQGYLHRIWQRACDERAVRRAVDVRYTGPWRTLHAFGWDHALEGRLLLTRRAGGSTVRLDQLTGSVLFALHPARPLVLASGRASAQVPLVFVPGRCDAHGLADSQQTFVFRATVRVGTGRAMRVYAEPDRETRRRALAMLHEQCR